MRKLNNKKKLKLKKCRKENILIKTLKMKNFRRKKKILKLIFLFNKKKENEININIGGEKMKVN